MAIERLPVIVAFIAEQVAELLQPPRIRRHQQVPEIVADLVPEVAQQRPVFFAEADPCAGARNVVGLGDVDRDIALIVSGIDRPLPLQGDSEFRARILVGHEAELQSHLRIFLLADDGQAQRQQRVQRAALCRFELGPVRDVLRRTEVGDDCVQPAGPAVRIGVFGRDHPVADLLTVIVVALPVDSRIGTDGAPQVGRFEQIERRDFQAVRTESHHAAAHRAADAVEKQRGALIAAAEKCFHWRCPRMVDVKFERLAVMASDFVPAVFSTPDAADRATGRIRPAASRVATPAAASRAAPADRPGDTTAPVRR